MTYVTEQTSSELRAHMRRLKAMAGWHEPLADRLFKEILELDAKVAALTPREAQAEPSDIERAKKILARLCDRGLLSMSIPVRRDDEDMVLSRVIALAVSVPVSAQEPSKVPFDQKPLAERAAMIAAELDERSEHLTRYTSDPMDGLLASGARVIEELLAAAPEAPQGAPGEAVEPRGPIDANALERMAKERPNEMFLKGSGVLKLLGGIRQLEGELRTLRAEGVMPGAWISAEDRLPEPDVEVLCAGQGWGNPFVTACRYDDEREGWWQIGSDYSDAHDGQQYPTHWMPLPEAPRAALQSTDQKGAGE